MADIAASTLRTPIRVKDLDKVPVIFLLSGEISTFHVTKDVEIITKAWGYELYPMAPGFLDEELDKIFAPAK